MPMMSSLFGSLFPHSFQFTCNYFYLLDFREQNVLVTFEISQVPTSKHAALALTLALALAPTSAPASSRSVSSLLSISFGVDGGLRRSH
jgi:hypothetical protein